MKIGFNKTRLSAHLILGFVWIIIGILNLSSKDLENWIGYVFIILGVLYLVHFFYDRKNKYLIIENGMITKNILYGFKNKMDLDAIQEIQKVKGNYILKSKTQKLKINLDLIDNSSLNKLIEVLRNLNLPSEKSFLASWK
ncbi:hypothetical protein ACFQ0R_13145 [Psychroflexus salinarum]|uniref:PH domain-containing protein n=1 Tax=Psychroflexus salinarum TaxID=546024 RepID=A0ABW3GW95_9FLAO